ncbi:MAG: hypothetical protein AB7O77_15280 [Phycisphaerales bacterium]
MSAWALTEHFLLTWIEWFQVSRLYSQYFGYGRGAEVAAIMMPGLGVPLFPGLPGTWASLHRQCQHIKDDIADDGYLPDILASAWGVDDPTVPRGTEDAEHWFFALAESHERRRLLGVYAIFAHPAWRDLYHMVAEQDRLLAARFNEAEGQTRLAVLTHLRFYRHATLDASWLSPEGVDSRPSRADAGESALQRLTYEPPPDREWASQSLDGLNLDRAVRTEVQQMLARIQRSVWEFGFSCLSEDLHSPDFRPATRSPVGTPAVVVNPQPPSLRGSARRERSRRELDEIVHFAPKVERWIGEREQSAIEPGRVALAVARPGGRGWKGLAPALSRLTGYLGQAQRLPDVAVVLTDAWDSAAFARHHRRELRPYATRGVRFLFLLAGVPDRTMSRISVAL